MGGIVGHVDGPWGGGGLPPTPPPWQSASCIGGAGWLQLWQVLWVCAGVWGWCSGVCSGAARQRKLTLGQQHPPGPDSPSPASEAPPESRTYRPHSERRCLEPVGITSPPVPVGYACRTCVCGCAEFWGHQLFWCLVRPGGAHRQPDQLTRPDLRLRGHGRDGGG